MKVLGKDFFDRDPVVAAKELLGAELVHETPDGTLSIRVVETEAYSEDDPACHAYTGWLKNRASGGLPTGRAAQLFGQPGFSYIYLCYGIHWLFNAIANHHGKPGAVLLRAGEPLRGENQQRINRRLKDGQQQRLIANGPGKICQALGLTGQHNQLRLGKRSGLYFRSSVRGSGKTICSTTRIGISQGQELPWRFYLTESSCVSVRDLASETVAERQSSRK